MVDPRFYESLGPIPAGRIAEALGANLVGDADVGISSVAAARSAGPADLAWVEGKGAVALSKDAGALIASPRDADAATGLRTLIVVSHPRAAFARASRLLLRPRQFEAGAAIHPTAEIEPGARIAPLVAIGAGARIGAETVIDPHVTIGPGVAIGRRTRIGAGASLECALVGDDCMILPGARIGQQGFGVAAGPGGPVEIPHFGRVVIMDRALIGANVTIDRGLFDDTTIGEDAKIDNLCQIAHNVVVGRGAMIAACAGVSGSTQIGDGAILAGRVGIADHRVIGAGATLAAGSAVMHDVPAGETWGGYPAKPIRRWLREVAWVQRASGRRDDGN